MTGILLEIIFTVAISRAFSLPLHDVITGGSPISPPQLSPSIHQMPSGCEGGAVRLGHDSTLPNKYSLSCGQSQIATFVDAFMSTHCAAYRSVQLLLLV